MPLLKNAKAEACVQLLAKGGGISEAEAYSKAFGGTLKSAYSNATVAMGKHGIRARVAELQAKAADKLSMSRTQWLEMLLRNARDAQAAEDYSASTGALRELGNAMPGWYSREAVTVGAGDGLSALIRQIRAR